MYIPRFPPQTPQELSPWLAQETQNIAKSMRDPREFLLMQVNHTAPKVPSDTRMAMLAIADGTDWNPGSGAGLYRYQNGSWTFIG